MYAGYAALLQMLGKKRLDDLQPDGVVKPVTRLIKEPRHTSSISLVFTLEPHQPQHYWVQDFPTDGRHYSKGSRSPKKALQPTQPILYILRDPPCSRSDRRCIGHTNRVSQHLVFHGSPGRHTTVLLAPPNSVTMAFTTVIESFSFRIV
jgi:hypothetical protein